MASDNSDMEVEIEVDDDAATDHGQPKAPDMTSLEKTLLMDLINEYKNVIEDKSRKFGVNTTKTNAWGSILTRFNSQPGVTKRTTQQIRGWWDNKKKRAKKSVTKSKRSRTKTGGGKGRPQPPADLLRVAAMIPSQMKSLENPFDSDHSKRIDEIEKEYLDPTGEADEPNENTPQEDIGDKDNDPTPPTARPSTESSARKYKDPRSSLTDMEYEEHKIRLRTLYLQYEEALIQKNLAKSTAEFQKEKQALKIELLRAQIQQVQGE